MKAVVDRSRFRGIGIVSAALAIPMFSAAAEASVTISSDATSHMKCSAGVCRPTAPTAVLNVGDLESLLASGNVVVTTTSSRAQAKDILVTAALGWSASSALTLDAYESLTIEGPVSVTGTGGVSLLTNGGGNGGTLSFGTGGDISFGSLSSALVINGASYTLVNSVALLASDIAANPNGNFALAQNYDASGDGTYGASPVGTNYGGHFEGLGNTISNLTIDDPASSHIVGLFAYVNGGSVLDLGLDNLSVAGGIGAAVGGVAAVLNSGAIGGAHVSGAVSGGDSCIAGGIVGEAAAGTIASSHSSATVAGGNSGADVGGLAGISSAPIINSYATGAVTGGQGTIVGGLVGLSTSTITLSFAGGKVTGGGGGSFVGGLVGESENTIANSYANGAVNDLGGGTVSDVGGLEGFDDGVIGDSYASGKVTGTGDTLGGLIGFDNSTRNKHGYWDRSTSTIKNKSQGAGNVANDIGIKGLTNTQFTAGLPKGFNRAWWAETTDINKGLPYLISNPPPQ